MTTRDLGTVGLRIVGVLLLASGLAGLPVLTGIPMADLDPLVRLSVVAQLWGAAITLVAGLVLVLAGRWLGERLFPEGSSAAATTIGREELLSVLFAVLGAYVLTDAIPNLIQLGLNFSLLGGLDYEYNRERFWQENWLSIIAEAVRFGLGVWLVVGGRGLAAAWVKLRPLSRSAENGGREVS